MTNASELLGSDQLGDVIDNFYGKVFNDPMLSPFFVGVNQETLKKMQKASFAVALGDPSPAIKSAIYRVHAGRGIERKHLSHFTELLLDSLKEVGLDEHETDRVIERIALYSDEVLGEAASDG